jgi:hypothetical protein
MCSLCRVQSIVVCSHCCVQPVMCSLCRVQSIVVCSHCCVQPVMCSLCRVQSIVVCSHCCVQPVVCSLCRVQSIVVCSHCCVQPVVCSQLSCAVNCFVQPKSLSCAVNCVVAHCPLSCVTVVTVTSQSSGRGSQERGPLYGTTIHADIHTCMDTVTCDVQVGHAGVASVRGTVVGGHELAFLET